MARDRRKPVRTRTSGGIPRATVADGSMFARSGRFGTKTLRAVRRSLPAGRGVAAPGAVTRESERREDARSLEPRRVRVAELEARRSRIAGIASGSGVVSRAAASSFASVSGRTAASRRARAGRARCGVHGSDATALLQPRRGASLTAALRDRRESLRSPRPGGGTVNERRTAPDRLRRRLRPSGTALIAAASGWPMRSLGPHRGNRIHRL
jgi:hypothetical protein